VSEEGTIPAVRGGRAGAGPHGAGGGELAHAAGASRARSCTPDHARVRTLAIAAAGGWPRPLRWASTPSSAPWSPPTCSPPPADGDSWNCSRGNRPARDRLGRGALGHRPELANGRPDRTADPHADLRSRPDPVPRAGRRAAVPDAGRHAVTVRRARPAAGRGVRAGPADRRGRAGAALGRPKVRVAPSSSARSGSATRTQHRPDREAPPSVRPSARPGDLAVYADRRDPRGQRAPGRGAGWIDRALARDPSSTARCTPPPGCATGGTARSAWWRWPTSSRPQRLAEHGDLAECCRGRPWLGRVTRRRPGGGHPPGLRWPTRRPARRHAAARLEPPARCDRGGRRVHLEVAESTR
jgi:hypothetical protein